jgi:hypothetical protein
LDKKQLSIYCAGFVLTVIVVGCFVAQTYQQQNFSYSQNPNNGISVPSIAYLNTITINKCTLLAFTPSISVKVPVITQAVLDNSTRSQIFTYISQNPGVQFRAIVSALCLPVGLAEYHLDVLVHSGLVSFIRDGRYKRFFVSKRFNPRDMALICILRRRTPKKIFEVLLSKRQLSHGRLAEEVAVTSQALTWQMKTLKDTNFILYVNEGLRIVYSIDQSAVPLLEKYLSVVD